VREIGVLGNANYRGIVLHTGILRKFVKTTICTAYTLFSKCPFLLFLQRHLKFERGVLNSVVAMLQRVRSMSACSPCSVTARLSSRRMQLIYILAGTSAMDAGEPGAGGDAARQAGAAVQANTLSKKSKECYGGNIKALKLWAVTEEPLQTKNS